MPFPKKKRVIDDEDDIIDDVEGYRGGDEIKYSHELLVMEQYRRVLKIGSQEMKKGWEERKEDRAGGTMSIKTHPDTRKEFAEAVKTLKNLLIGSIAADKVSKENVPKLFKDLIALQKQYVELEEKGWKQIPEKLRHPASRWIDRWDHIPNTLNYDHIYGEKYLQQSVEIFRAILEEIGLLLHRMGYFKGEIE